MGITMRQMDNITIRTAVPADLMPLVQLLDSCAHHMSKQGMHHWLDVYNKDTVEANMQHKQVFVAVDDKKVVACIALGCHKADYYQDCWPQAPDADYYITQLAVAPAYQGNGLATELMKLCFNYTQNTTVQLDAVDHYPELLQFYQKLGFKIIATGIGLGDKRHLMQIAYP